MKKYIFIVFLVVKLIEAVDVTNPMFWERSFSLNISNPNAYGSLIQSTSFIVASQDFQGLNTLADYRTTTERVMFNFGECCQSSNTSMATLQAWNYNSIHTKALQSAQNMALVKRGNCNWSEKISVVNNLSLLNNLNITAIMIYDNNTYDASVQISSTAVTGVGSISPPDFSSPLPPSRDILNFTDNDLHSATDPIVYFVPNNYGTTFVNRLNAMYNSTHPNMRYYWLITPYFDQVTWGFSGSDDFFATGKGYLSYIIALAAIFVIAIIVVRWWRIRRARLYGGNMTDGNGFPMQPRSNHVDPLPVDIVNKLSISVYSEGLVKNENCAICLEDFVPGKTDLRLLPCGHGFCVLCIDPWLTQKSTLCPICKWDCLPSDLRVERDLQQQSHPTIPEPTFQGPHPQMNDRGVTPPSTGNTPSSSAHIEFSNTSHATIPPIPTHTTSPMHDSTSTSQDNNNSRIHMSERQESSENPFVNPVVSNPHSMPSTSTVPAGIEESPAFTTVKLSDKSKET